MMQKIFFFIVLSSIAAYAQCANCHYVREGASGDGSDWANAFGTLPNSLSRGYTYYIADGNYGYYRFDDPEDGRWITIKKAIGDDHGTSVGWDTSYGDGKAVFTGTTGNTWVFITGKYLIDGQTGEMKSGYGFVVNNTYSGSQYVDIISVADADNIVLEHVEGHHYIPCFSVSCYPHSGVYTAAYNSTNLTIRNCFFHDTHYSANILTRGVTNLVIEGNYFMDVHRKEVLSDYYSRNVVFRNNILENTAGTGAIIFKDIFNWSIYNNLFFWTDARFNFTNSFIGTWTGEEVASSHNVRIYGNTFADYAGLAMGFRLDGSPTGIEAYNNLFYNCSSRMYSTGGDAAYFFMGVTHDFNWFYDVFDPRDAENEGILIAASEPNGQYGAGNPFVSGMDFRLRDATSAGRTLSEPYDLDILGSRRGADGVWDRGAIEYQEGFSVSGLLLAIEKWKRGEITITQLLDAIRRWKEG